MQAALGALLKDGFIVTRGRRGTFVADRPPHLFRHGLVLHEHPAQLEPGAMPCLARFILQQVNELAQRDVHDFRVYFSVAGHAADDATRRLAADIQSQRLAGLVFVTPTLARTPYFRELIQRTGIPCVAMTSVGLEDLPDIGGVVFPRAVMIDLAIAALAAQGRRRLAILTVSYHYDNHEDIAMYHASAKAHGMELARGQIIGTVPMTDVFTRFAVHALLNSRHAPDALFLTDDSLVPSAAAALNEAGVRVPQDLAVVAHTNFPYASPTDLPFRRVGCDVRAAVGECVAAIGHIRRDGRPPAPTLLPTLLDDQVNA